MKITNYLSKECETNSSYEPVTARKENLSPCADKDYQGIMFNIQHPEF